MDNTVVAGLVLTFFSAFWLLIACVMMILSLLLVWLYIVCFIDVASKNEIDFPNKTVWLIILVLSIFIPFGFIAPIVYYFMYKPNLKFWNK